MKPGPKSGPDFGPFFGAFSIGTLSTGSKNGVPFLARVLGGGVPPRPSLWSSLLEP